MFGNKTYLKIGDNSGTSITALYKGSYELMSCSFGFSQGIDAKGQTQTNVRGGLISMVYANIPPDELLAWMLDSRKYESGTLVFCDEHGIPLEKVLFENAACIAMSINYIRRGNSYTSTSFTLHAQKIQVGDTTLDNSWSME
jgi:hypothetical protein